jgi:predicted O-methyltransferase YrrM
MSGDRFSVDQTTFQAVTADYFDERGLDVDENDFFVCKFRPEVDGYVELFRSLAPERIFELGMHGGGSTVFFAELARPRKLVSIDLEPLEQVRRRVEGRAAAIGLSDAVRIFTGVDQSDRNELARIAEAEFDGALDLVVDDCSHLYDPARQSFNELFPRLRAGGVYVIEDWRWGHIPRGDEQPAQGVPDRLLSRLIAEIILAGATMPGLAAETTVDLNGVSITRGDTPLDPGTFDVSSLVDTHP